MPMIYSNVDIMPSLEINVSEYRMFCSFCFDVKNFKIIILLSENGDDERNAQHWTLEKLYQICVIYTQYHL